MALGIRKRRDDDPYRSDFSAPAPLVEQPSVSQSGIAPRARDNSFPSTTQPEPVPESLVAETALPSSADGIALGKVARRDTPSPPSSSIDEMALGKVASRGVPRPRTAQDEWTELSTQKPKDKNGRVKSAILNALMNMGQQANRALSSGRPIDEYALAGIGGAGIGGGVHGAVDPTIDEETKRRYRMRDLASTIRQDVQMQQEQAQLESIQAQTDKNRAWEGIQTRELADRAANEAEKARQHAEDRDRQAFHTRLGIKERMRLPLDEQDVKDGARFGFSLDPQQWHDAVATKDTAFTSHFVHDEKTGQNIEIRTDKKTQKVTSHLVPAPVEAGHSSAGPSRERYISEAQSRGLDPKTAGQKWDARNTRPLVTTSGTQLANEDRDAARTQRLEDQARRKADTEAHRDSDKQDSATREASAAVDKFASLTREAEASTSARQRRAILHERDSLEKRMRQLYGDVLEDDDKGKPTVLKLKK